ncbi:hypothetical protein BJX70DRAFT_372524 [Aspergillus crustosus]
MPSVLRSWPLALKWVQSQSLPLSVTPSIPPIVLDNDWHVPADLDGDQFASDPESDNGTDDYEELDDDDLVQLNLRVSNPRASKVESPKAREIRLAWHRNYYRTMKASMSPDQLADFRAKNAADRKGQRKANPHRVINYNKWRRTNAAHKEKNKLAMRVYRETNKEELKARRANRTEEQKVKDGHNSKCDSGRPEPKDEKRTPLLRGSSPLKTWQSMKLNDKHITMTHTANQRAISMRESQGPHWSSSPHIMRKIQLQQSLNKMSF